MRDILLYGYWHGIFQRPHHLVKWLKNRGINTHILTQKPLFQRPAEEFRYPQLCSDVHYITNFPLPTRLMTPVRKALTRAQEMKAYHELADNVPVIIYNISRALPRKAKPLVFDCLDDFAGFGSTRNREYDHLQKNLARKADVIWATSHKLYNLWHRHYPDKTYMVANGADVEDFASVVEYAPAAERPLLQEKKAIVGYFGAISPWFDRKLLLRVAENLPEVQFVLVGPVYSGCEEKYPCNVSLLGIRPYKELPKLACQWDCCIVPFVINELTKATNPVKMYEYLAAGKPVVATRLPEVQKYERAGIVETADNPKDFSAAIMKSIESCWDRSLIDERIAIAKKNSWEARFESAYETIKQFLPSDWD